MTAPVPVAPRGRIPPRENAAPPLWFGVAFAIAGGGMIAFGLSAPAEGGVVFAAFGLFFGTIGVALAVTTVRAERARTPAHADGLGFVDVFTRSPMRILVDFVLAPLGGVGFLVFAFVFLGAGPMGFIATAMFLFFGILVLRGSVLTIRRGVRRTVAEVGPAGLWIQDLPRRLAWSEIDRLEVEAARGAAGDAGVATYRRLGIWPSDPDLRDRAPGRGMTGMVGAFAGFVNSIAPGAGISDPSKLAPYGINAFELEQDFATLLRSVARYARIGGLPDDATAMLDTVRGAPVPPAPLPDGVLGAALENLARASGAHVADPGAFAAGAPAGMSASPATAEAGLPPARTFVRRPGAGSVARMFNDAWMALFLIVIPVLFVGPQVLIGGAVLGLPVMWGFDLVALAFLGFGIGSLLEMPGRWRMARGDPALVTVDERGIEMRGMGRLAWSQVAETRVVGSSIPTQEGRPAIRRLEIVPLDPARLADRPWSDRAYDGFRAITGRLTPFGRRRRAGGAFAIDLDLLQDPERLLDTIACYRLVDES